MSQTKQYPMQFTGTGGEYFAIWIVNITLSLITFGIYSAWAKVRTLRWFYGHTLLDNQAFSYLATPMQILKGRLIALAAIAAYYMASYFAPAVAIGLLVVFLIFTPWIVVNSLRFQMRQSAYRGLRFDFKGTVGEAARVYIGLQLLIPLTLGLIIPYLAYRQVKFIAENTVYGETEARYQGSLKPFWGVYLLSFALILLPIAVIAFGSYQTYVMRAAGMPPEVAAAAAGPYMVAGIVLLYLMFPVIGGLIQARTANLLYNGTGLGPVGFASTQRARDVIWIHVSNLILIALTFGLFVPWAKVRLARYRAERLTVAGPEELGSFVAGQRHASTATGSEMADLLDLNFGLT